MGKFSGQYCLQPIGPRLFNYLPNDRDPFTYITNDGMVITPQTMQTDGATVPWPVRGLPGYDPWDWPAGAIIHDWLYEAHHRGLAEVSFTRANQILGEVLKDLGIPLVRRNSIVLATHLGGWVFWNRPIWKE
jgi:hypothetical protein